jgi:hypothetical protein
MDSQTVITALLVVACSAYAAWHVMPATLRRKLAAWAGRPLPAASGGCGGGCDGCGSSPAPGRTNGEAVIRIVRQPHADQHHR